jgi:hypothetical protein
MEVAKIMVEINKNKKCSSFLSKVKHALTLILGGAI